MADDKYLELIMRLRAETNNSEAKKIKGQIEKIHSATEKAVKGINSGFAEVSKETIRLKKELNDLAASMGGLGKGTSTNNIQKGIKVISDAYADLIRQVKLVKDTQKGLARGSLESEAAIKKGIVAIKEYNTLLKETASAVAKVVSSQETMSQQTSKIEYTTSALRKLASRYLEVTTNAQKVIKVTNRLEASLRDIQTLSEFKGFSNFEKGIRSSREFNKELEKLVISFRKITGDKLASSIAVPKKLILEFRRVREEINKIKSSAQTMNTSFAKVKNVRNQFYEVARSVGEVDLRLKDAIKNTDQLNNTNLRKIANEYKALKEQITRAMNELGTSSGKTAFSSLEKDVSKTIEKIKARLKEVGVDYEKLEGMQTESLKSMEKHLLSYQHVQEEAWANSAKGFSAQQAVLDKSAVSIQKLEKHYGQFQEALALARRGVISFAEVNEYANKTLQSANVILSTAGHGFTKLAKHASAAAKSFMIIDNAIDFVDAQLKELQATITSVTAKEKELAIASKYMGNSVAAISSEVDLARERLAAFDSKILIITRRMALLKPASRPFQHMQRELAKLSIEANKASANLQTLENKLQQTTHKTGDANRAMSRLSAEGFANMIVSQAAWMAGFVLIFGSIDQLKKAFQALIDTQVAVSRAMRTVRSDFHDQKQIYNELTGAVNEMRASMGTVAADTGEMLYQLGSAGLDLNESLAALKPTMDNVVGSEANMEQITNLVAGVYNNFGDSIVKVNGEMKDISRTFDGYSKDLVTATNVTEKFNHINDLLIATFDQHQAEMDQIRDGLKFMAQSAMQANLSLTQQLGILATLHDHFIKAGAAGRGMRVILSRITKEAASFKEAFNLSFDLNAPLNFLEIVEELSKKVKDQVMTVEELGEVFTRMGLRGTEPLLVLIQNFEELKGNIDELGNTSAHASENMRKLQLDNIAAQADILFGKIEVLIKTGLEPLAVVIRAVIDTLNFLGDAFKAVNSATGGFLGFMIKFAGFTALIVGAGIAWRNFHKTLSFVKELFTVLAKRVRTFSEELETNKSKTHANTQALKKSAEVQKTYSERVKKSYNSMNNFTYSSATMLKKASLTTRAINGLKAAFIGLGAAMKATIILAIVAGLVQLVMWLSKTEERFAALVKKQAKSLAENEKYLDNLDDLRLKLREINEVTIANEATVKRAADITGIYVSSISELNNELGNIKKGLQEYIDIQKRMVEAQKFTTQIDQMKQIGIEVNNLTKYGKATISVWGKIGIIFQKALDKNILFQQLSGLVSDVMVQFQAWYGLLVKFENLLIWEAGFLTRPWNALMNKLKELVPWLDKIFDFFNIDVKNDNLDSLSQKYIDLQTQVKGYQKALQDLWDIRKKTTDKRTVEILTKQIAALEHQTEATEKNRDAVGEQIDAYKKAHGITMDLAEAGNYKARSDAKAARQTDQLAKIWSEFYIKSKNASKTVYDAADAFTELTAGMFASGRTLKEWNAAVEGIGSQTGLKNFKIALQELRDEIMWFDRDSPETFMQLLKMSQKLAKDGSGFIKEYKTRIEDLRKEIKGLRDDLYGYKMDQFNTSIQDSSDRMNNLKSQFANLGSAAKKSGEDTSASMHLVGKSMDGISISMSSAASATDKSNKMTREQRKLMNEMLFVQTDIIEKTYKQRSAIEEQIKVKGQEAQAYGKSVAGMEASKTAYGEQLTIMAAARQAIFAERDAIKERIKIEEDLHRITSAQAIRERTEADIDAQNKLNKLAIDRKGVEEIRIKTTMDLIAAKEKQMKEEQAGLEALKILLADLVLLINQMVVSLGLKGLPEEAQRARDIIENAITPPVDVDVQYPDIDQNTAEARAIMDRTIGKDSEPLYTKIDIDVTESIRRTESELEKARQEIEIQSKSWFQKLLDYFTFIKIVPKIDEKKIFDQHERIDNAIKRWWNSILDFFKREPAKPKIDVDNSEFAGAEEAADKFRRTTEEANRALELTELVLRDVNTAVDDLHRKTDGKPIIDTKPTEDGVEKINEAVKEVRRQIQTKVKFETDGTQTIGTFKDVMVKVDETGIKFSTMTSTMIEVDKKAKQKMGDTPIEIEANTKKAKFTVEKFRDATQEEIVSLGLETNTEKIQAQMDEWRKKEEEGSPVGIPTKAVIDEANRDLEVLRKDQKEIPITIPTETNVEKVRKEIKEFKDGIENKDFIKIGLAIAIAEAEADVSAWAEKVNEHTRARVEIDAKVTKAQERVDRLKKELEKDPANVELRLLYEWAQKDLEKWKRKAAAPESAIEIQAKIELEKAKERLELWRKELEKEKDPILMSIDANTTKVDGKILKLNDDIQKTVKKNVDDKEIVAAQALAKKLNQDLAKKIIKEVQIKVTGDEAPGSYRGGLIQKFTSGGYVPARVTHGEGFIPPDVAQRNIAALTRLNNGGTTSAVPANMGTFVGAKGVDRISTYLPTGSYVLSKKGMEAYERSVDQGAQTFQSGGEVQADAQSTTPPPVGVQDKEQSFGTLTIVVEKEGSRNEYPVTGEVSVIKGLREELEQERLTRLH
jgi:TP901 family phage tail tape measure protein